MSVSYTSASVACRCVSLCVCIFVCMCVNVCLCICICVCVHVCICVCACMCACRCAYMYGGCVCVFIGVCLCVCVCERSLGGGLCPASSSPSDALAIPVCLVSAHAPFVGMRGIQALRAPACVSTLGCSSDRSQRQTLLPLPACVPEELACLRAQDI